MADYSTHFSCVLDAGTPEKAALGRQEFRANASTPWGPSQGAVRYGEGVVFHSTSGHGGFHLSAARNAKVHPMLRDAGGWYEEDAAWAAVATAWPDLFTGFERRQAEATLRHSWPDAWEGIHGRKLRPGESRTRDAEAFARDHAEDWVVISAIYSDHHPSFTEVVATRGGLRDQKAEERRFLVPSAEYKVGSFGFVIDESRHAVYDGPSSFIGWRGCGVHADRALAGGGAMTRKPQIAWGLRIKTSGEDFIVLWTIRRTRKDAEETFWQEYEYYGPQARTNIEQRFKDGTYRFVKVQIIPVEGEDD